MFPFGLFSISSSHVSLHIWSGFQYLHFLHQRNACETKATLLVSKFNTLFLKTNFELLQCSALTDASCSWCHGQKISSWNLANYDSFFLISKLKQCIIICDQYRNHWTFFIKTVLPEKNKFWVILSQNFYELRRQ